MYTDKSLVLCSPTGSGKTAVFEMAIVRLMTRSSSLNSSVKIVYSRLTLYILMDSSFWFDTIHLGVHCTYLGCQVIIFKNLSEDIFYLYTQCRP